MSKMAQAHYDILMAGQSREPGYFTDPALIVSRCVCDACHRTGDVSRTSRMQDGTRRCDWCLARLSPEPDDAPTGLDFAHHGDDAPAPWTGRDVRHA